MAEEKPTWITAKPADVEKLIIELAKKGESPEKIGLILRDQHGIPKAKLVGKKITQIIKEAKITLKSEKEKITQKIEKTRAHATKNKHDHPAGRSITKSLWALHRINNQ